MVLTGGIGACARTKRHRGQPLTSTNMIIRRLFALMGLCLAIVGPAGDFLVPAGVSPAGGRGTLRAVSEVGEGSDTHASSSPSATAQCRNFQRSPTTGKIHGASCSGSSPNDVQRILKAAEDVCDFRSDDCQIETQPRFTIVMEPMDSTEYGFVSVRDPYTIHLASNHPASTSLTDGLIVGSALAHELMHTRQLLAGHNKGNTSCLELEREAFQEQDAYLAHFGYKLASGNPTSRAEFDCNG